MKDTRPTDFEMGSKSWVTNGYSTPVIFQYANEQKLREKRHEIKYYVDFLSTGTGMVINNGSLYYHQHDSDRIVKYNLNNTKHLPVFHLI